jgi:hypothetical protein
MNRILKTASLMVLTLLLSLPGSYAQADTTTSGGQAIIPPFHLLYLSSNHRLNFHMQVANISNETVHVIIKYFKNSGEVAKTAEMDIAAKAIGDASFDTSSTPGGTMLPFYGTIEWTGPYTAQKPLVAHAFVRYYTMSNSIESREANSLSINNGMPF